jgi:hypothetical protein
MEIPAMHEEEVFIAFAGMCTVVTLVWIITRYCHLTIRAWYDSALKRDMVARGYSAQEIIAVVNADRRCRSKAALFDVPPAKPIRQPAYN